MDGLLVVERTRRFERTLIGGPKHAIKTSTDTYCGIEGTPWPDDALKNIKISCGLAMSEQLPEILNYYYAISKNRKCDLLYIQTREVLSRIDSPPPGFIFSGYDFGNYISEHNFFSVIFNEVLLGKYTELKEFASRLNANLLFDKEDDLEDIELTRATLTKNGADLETTEMDEGFDKIEVYRLSK